MLIYERVSTNPVALRRRADRWLLRRLLTLAADPHQPSALRRLAGLGARLFYAKWIKAGHSGRRLPAGMSLRLYGRYCGPGNSGPGEPIDSLDEACYRHDKAYEHAELLEAFA